MRAHGTTAGEAPIKWRRNGKISHKSLKEECIRPGTPLSLDDVSDIQFSRALCQAPAFLYRGYILLLQKNPESESVRDQQ
jgi:hypothetical protein